MLRRLLLVLALVLSTVPAAAAAETAEECDEVRDDTDELLALYCSDQAWFTESTGKAGNLAALGVTDEFPSWDREEPTASVTEGAGGGYHGNPWIDIVAPQSPEAGATFEGTLNGDIDTVALDLYLFQPTENIEPLASGQHAFRADIRVDGQIAVLHSSEIEASVEPAGDAVFRLRVAFTDLGMDTGAPLEQVERDVYINITPWFFTRDEAIYVYDTVEAPSALIVNPDEETLADFEVFSRF